VRGKEESRAISITRRVSRTLTLNVKHKRDDAHIESENIGRNRSSASGSNYQIDRTDLTPLAILRALSRRCDFAIAMTCLAYLNTRAHVRA